MKFRSDLTCCNYFLQLETVFVVMNVCTYWEGSTVEFVQTTFIEVISLVEVFRLSIDLVGGSLSIAN